MLSFIILFISAVWFFLHLWSQKIDDLINYQKFDYFISVGRLNRLAAEEFCEQRNLKLPLPISTEDKIETLPSYWIRVKKLSSQWVDSETLTQVWFEISVKLLALKSKLSFFRLYQIFNSDLR